jgi:tripartite-type tricarboxylate transporter receptor subunit TctC
MAGRVQLYFSAGEPVVSMVKHGKLKAFASTGATREAALPDVPTMAEAGFANITVDPSDWTGLVAPAGIPNDVVAKLHSAIGAALTTPGVMAMLEKLGWTASSTDPNAFAKFISANVERWGKIVREAHLKKAD